MIQHSQSLAGSQLFNVIFLLAVHQHTFAFLILQWADICNRYSWRKAQYPTHTFLPRSPWTLVQGSQAGGPFSREDLCLSLYSSHNSFWPQPLLGVSFQTSSLHASLFHCLLEVLSCLAPFHAWPRCSDVPSLHLWHNSLLWPAQPNIILLMDKPTLKLYITEKRPKGILIGSFMPLIVLQQSYSNRLLEEFLWALEDQLQWRDD